jgi:NitT/TauT family transport system substrate-binding protein
MRRVRGAGLIVVALLAAACGTPGPRAAPAGAGAASTPAPASGGNASAPAEVAPSPPGPPVKVTACIPSRSDQILPIYAAQEGGYLREQNIEADIPFFAGGAVDAAFTAGQCDFIMGAGGIGPLLQGLDVTVVAVTTAIMPGEIWGRPPLRTLADLKGRTLGTTGAGSLSWRVGRYYLQSNGLNPDEDVAVMALGDSNSTYGAVVAGRVDSALLFPPHVFRAPKDGLNLIYQSPPSTQLMTTGLVTSKRYLAANRDVVRRMVKALTDTLVRLKSDEAFYGEKLRAFTNNPELTPEAVHEYWAITDRLFNVPPRGTLEGAVLALSLYAERPPDAELEAIARAWLDMSLVDELYPPGSTP